MAAAQMGKKIPVPITVTNYIRLLASGGLGKSQKYLVDELQMMLEQMNVEAATVDSRTSLFRHFNKRCGFAALPFADINSGHLEVSFQNRFSFEPFVFSFVEFENYHASSYNPKYPEYSGTDTFFKPVNGLINS